MDQSIVGRASKSGWSRIERWDIRDWAEGKHKQVDDRPFGGGPGMVLMSPPWWPRPKPSKPPGRAAGRPDHPLAAGPRFDQARVEELAAERRMILVCGRYEGFDERIIEVLQPELLSVGDFVLSGGEVAAMVVIDAVVRLVPGVLGDAESAVDESFGPDGGLEYPQYTRPRVFRRPGGPRRSVPSPGSRAASGETNWRRRAIRHRY